MSLSPISICSAPATRSNIVRNDAVELTDYSRYKFRAEVDWIELRIVTTAPTNFQTVRRRLGVGFADPKDSGAGGACTEFYVKFQAPKSWATIQESLKELTVDHRLAEPVMVTGIEVALDAYSINQTRNDLVDMTARFYHGAALVVSDNRRASKRQGESYGLETLPQLHNLIADGYNIYIGNQSDTERQHIYLKETDSSTALPPNQHRARTEFTLEREKLPTQSFQDWEGNDFTTFAPYFKFRRLKSDLPPDIAAPKRMMAQVGARRARKTPQGHYRAFSRSTVADSKLNALAFDALRELNRRWRASV